jgi:hypothetical protein
VEGRTLPLGVFLNWKYGALSIEDRKEIYRNTDESDLKGFAEDVVFSE